MIENEKDKLNDYTQRHREWRDISVTQLSNTNNILLTLSSGLLFFCFEKSKITNIHLNSKESFDWTVITYVIAIIFISISMMYGIAVLFSRLYDFKISRHLALTRQRFYKKHTKTLSDQELGDFNFRDRIEALRKILFSEPSFITSDEIRKLENEDDTRERFDNLRRISKILGTATWKWTKFQVLLFLLSFLAYFINRLLLK